MIRLSHSSLAFSLAYIFSSFDGGRGTRISAPLPRAVLGDVVEARYGADGQWLVYRADPDEDEAFELFGVRADGSGAPVRLDTVALPGGDVLSFALDAGGTRVVYRADQEADNVFELFVVPVDGSSAPQKLNGPLVAGGDVDEYALSPDGTRVVYRADAFTDGRFVLSSVRLDRAFAPVMINTPLLAGGSDVEEFLFTPDGGRVVFHLDQFAYDQLGVAPADGSAPGQVLWSGNDGIPQRFEIDPTGQRVLYLFAGANVVQLFSLRLDGSALPVRLSPALPSGRAVTEFHVASDGQTVLYRADADANELYELFAVPSDGGAPLQLNDEMAVGHFVGLGIALTPDDTRAVYRTEFYDGTRWLYDLWVVPVDASAAPLRISGPPSTFGGPSGFRLSPDGVWLAYEHVDTNRSVLSARLDGSVSPIPFASNFLCVDYRISPDGSTLVYTGSLCGTANGGSRLFARPLDGSAPAVELGGATGSIEAGAFEIAPGGETVAFVEDADERGEFELFTRALDGAGPLQQLSGPLPRNAITGAVTRFRADATSALYAEGQRLIRVPVGGGAPVELSQALFTQLPNAFELAPGGQRAVFLANRPGGARLFSAPPDGSAPALELSGPLVSGGMVWSFALSADGTQVAFVADKNTNDVLELYRVPVDGSASPQKISAPLPSGGRVAEYALTADGARVVYRADQLTFDQFELFSGDGVNPPLRLNEPLPAQLDVGANFRLSPDGARVLFTAPTASLFSAPSDGSSAAVLLTGQLAAAPAEPFRIAADSSFVVCVRPQGLFRVPLAGGSALQLVAFDTLAHRDQVLDLQLGPQATHVVYLMNRDVQDRFELYRVPLDASAPSEKLSGTLPSTGDVLDFRITPDQSRVVYRARLDPFVEELFSAPFDASASPVRLNPAFGSFSDVTSFQLVADGSLAVYRADPSDTVFELFAVPTAGGRPAVRLSAMPALDGDVQPDFALTPDGARALFRLDTKSAGAFELFASPLTGRTRTGTTPDEFVERPR